MTMPHLMNCSHSEDSWCLSCVKELWLEKDKLETELEKLKETKSSQRAKGVPACIVCGQPVLVDNVCYDHAKRCCSCNEPVGISKAAEAEIDRSVAEVTKERDAALAEVERLKRGDFSKEELHNLCHKVSETESAENYDAGCHQWQRQLFGRAPSADRIKQLEARVAEQAAEIERLSRLVDAERAAVVAWLRMKSSKQKKEAEGAMTPWYAAEQDALSCENATNADAIARGEHHKN